MNEKADENAGSAEASFERLLDFLRQNRGIDFTGYKRPSLMRRVQRRMQSIQVENFDAYTDYLQVHPEEFEQIFNTILINVTSFFRDPAAWEVIGKEVIPAVLKDKGEHGPVRVWSAGCASGEEAYTIAILLAEALGAEQFNERVKVYATDVDEEALNQARHGSYSEKHMEGLEPALRTKYFDRANGRFVFRADLRRAVIFGRHDLVQDAPISRLDLLICRNTLMYFNAESQSRVLSKFHFALNGQNAGGNGARTGYLFLGRAEMPLAQTGLFTPIDLKARVFRIADAGTRPRPPLPVPAGEAHNGGRMARTDRLHEQALDDAPVARIVVDSNGVLALANQRARLLFSINPRDVGRPLQDLEISYRPVELRSMIEQAYAEQRTVTRTSVERRFAEGEPQYLDVIVAPIMDESQKALGVGVSFVDVTRFWKLQEELRASREEIQTTSEELQSSNEELETTNEELQSSNEELETTNEELQSTNEELETMNEELQSTNEALQTVNEELRQRTDELHHSNAFLESVLASMRAAAVVVDQNMNILVWNHRAEDMWGVRSDEVRGTSLLNLDIGLPVADLHGLIRPCLAGDGASNELTVDAVNRRGKKIRCHVTCAPLVSGGKRQGVILMMEELG